MRDISPAEAEVLERAASHVDVYVRKQNLDPEVTLDLLPGCYECNHAVGPLTAPRSYSTWHLASADLLDDYGVENAPFFRCVVSFNDRMLKEAYETVPWIHNVVVNTRNGTFPYITTTMLSPFAIRDLPDLYVRIYLDRDGNTIHSNSRINIWQAFLNEVDGIVSEEALLGHDLVVYSSALSGSSNYCAYADPEFNMASAALVPFQNIRGKAFSPGGFLALKKIYGLSKQPVLLEMVVPKARMKRKSNKFEQEYNGAYIDTLDPTFGADS